MPSYKTRLKRLFTASLSKNALTACGSYPPTDCTESKIRSVVSWPKISRGGRVSSRSLRSSFSQFFVTSSSLSSMRASLDKSSSMMASTSSLGTKSVRVSCLTQSIAWRADCADKHGVCRQKNEA
eukprot:scaffold209952_cov37-Attheya_sp.AAC.1